MQKFKYHAVTTHDLEGDGYSVQFLDLKNVYT